MTAAALDACLHCGTPLVDPSSSYCCGGCRTVHRLIVSSGLARYYDLQGPDGVPVPDLHLERRDRSWLEETERALAAASGAMRVTLDVQGLHCAACVWLIETVAKRRDPRALVQVDPTVGRVVLVVDGRFDLRGFVEAVERFGYLVGPPLKARPSGDRDLRLRMGLCIAIAMNSMLFAIALYAGLTSGALADRFRAINLVLSAASVVIGGSVFFRAAIEGLRRRMLHLDLPIALGIALAFTGSAIAFATGRERGFFADTLNVFIALMLVGRWLQARVLERNRLAVLASDGAEGLAARRRRGSTIELVRCPAIAPTDRLVIAPGDLVPVEATLDADAASFSLDWINGESRPRAYRRGEPVPAGAFLAGSSAVDVIARQGFADSALVELLRTPIARTADRPRATRFWQRFARIYVLAVVALAATGMTAWWIVTRDPGRALDVGAALLMVTCPCAIGIALPVADDLALAGLRRGGLFVRGAGFLDRAAGVRTVVFDKTGTLTNGALRLVDDGPLRALAERDRAVLAGLAAGSSHPKSAATALALAGLGVVPTTLTAEETAGAGLTAIVDGATYRFGSGAWLGVTGAELAFVRDGATLATLATEEDLRPDAKAEVAALRADGHEVWLLSGDDRSRVLAVAERAGIPADHAIGNASPDDKAAWARAHDRGDLLMLGDGINDGLAVAAATCSGTPAIDRPFMAARSDFYFVTPGLRPVRRALDVARLLATLRRRALIVALTYNALAVGLALGGVLTPLACAVLMPLSSLSTLLATGAPLAPGRPLWRS